MQTITMNDGHAIPQLGCGVYMMNGDELSRLIPTAIETGYRHFDTANAYFNEVALGRALAESGVPRAELFITSKLFPQSYPTGQTGPDIDATLERLGTDYLDLLLLHQPYGAYVEAWPALEDAVSAGKVRSIGLSNFPVHKIEEIMRVATIRPAVLQVELNPYWTQHELRHELERIGLGDVTLESWYPFGHGDAEIMREPVLVEAAQAHGKSVAQVILRWALQEGVVVFPKTLNPEHMRENFDVFGFELSADEMARIDAIPQHPYYVVPEDAPDFVLVHNDYSKQI
ncbi:aldo/keto reductase [Olsenella profusa]|uniref:Aldo/keto reductase n=1 Tax=Olsenella profusa TaxID=138595 RepID=A0ABS2EZR4_9ACTN|nr:aldo/keto reductase [Olsenella profusa]MBM6774216.1 aldo/keto reductase [Olsenella profusa]